MTNRKKWIAIVAGGLALLILLCSLPPVSSRVFARLDQVRLRLFYMLNPPEEEVFKPGQGQDDRLAEIVQATMAALSTPQMVPTVEQTLTSTPTLKPNEPTFTPAPPTRTPTPLPESALIEDMPYIDQHYGQNECAPANLAMALTFWGWQGSREELSKYVKPFERDKNVMPYELSDYVNTQTQYRAVVRFGGTPVLLKALVSEGFPVVVERGVYLRDMSGKVSWMGHYQVIYGYDDGTQIYQVKDSFDANGSRFQVSYVDLIRGWRSFNYAFLVVYPPDHEGQVMALLGSYANEASANRSAYEIASSEIATLKGQDLFFAWYNRGSSQVQLQDFTGAAQTYDQAFAVYADLPASERPWRVTWYQTGPYFAYFYSGRYQDVLDLANTTISSASDPFLEENFYWRAKAKAALGDTAGAVEDLRKSLEYHPEFSPSLAELSALGAVP